MGRPARATPGLSAQEIVAGRVSAFVRKRRAIIHAMAKSKGIDVPPELEKFFDAAEAGQWDELTAIFSQLKANQGTNSGAMQSLRAPMVETYGVAEVAHNWPPQKLLEFGESVLGSLPPGMVYVGGTDAGRFIPTLLNDTAEGDSHVILTQNALADSSYLDYMKFLYGDRIAALSAEDSQQAFSQYTADAQKRLEHDQAFSDEPRQVRPGEDIRMIDGRVQVAGQVAVMAINERLLAALMDKNPGMSFGLEESMPFKSTYGTASPLGPVIELRTPEDQALTTDVASRTVDYWRSNAGEMLVDAGAADSNVRSAYSKMAAAQARLLDARNFAAEAGQIYEIALQFAPGNPETVYSYTQYLLNQKRTADAVRVLEEAVAAAPANAQFAALLQQVRQRGK